MTLKKHEIAESASALAGLLHAGQAVAQATARCALLQPAHADLWHRVSAACAEGHSLSQTLDGVWPPALLAALRAGEDSGTIESVLDEIEATIEMESQIRGVAGQLIPPAMLILAAIAMFVGLCAFVVPTVSASINSSSARHGSSNWVLTFGLAAQSLLLQHGILAGLMTAGGIAALVYWLRTPAGRDASTNLLFAMPYVGRPLQDLQYTLWGRYVALMLAAGVPIFDTLEVTANVLPRRLGDSVRTFRGYLANDNRTMDAAAQLMQDEWPFYIANAFMLGHAHGSPEIELTKIIPRIQKQAVGQIARGTAAAMLMAKIVGGLIIGLGFFAVYSPIIQAVKGSI